MMLRRKGSVMRALAVLLFSVVMLGACFVLLFAACQPGLRLGFAIDGNWYDLAQVIVALLLIQMMLWTYLIVLSAAACFRGKKAAGTLRDQAEQTLSRAADAIKDMILDLGAPREEAEPADKPELGTGLLRPLVPREFVLSMRGKTDEALALVAQVINAAPTGQEIAASEEQIETLLADLRFDAMAMGLYLRSSARDPDPVPVTPNPLSTKSGKAKSYAASEYWRPVWVERFRSMRAADTAFRLAEQSRRRQPENN